MFEIKWNNLTVDKQKRDQAGVKNVIFKMCLEIIY